MVLKTFGFTVHFFIISFSYVINDLIILYIYCAIGKTLNFETVDTVRNFYRNSEISVMMPGKKDLIKIKDGNGNKKEIQKRLLLGSLREIYANFKEEHPDLKIGFSRFASLRPPECVFVRSSGTHTVCVCTTHQNAKLSILGTVFTIFN